MTDAAFPAILPTYNRTDIAFERGEGAWLFTSDGRRFLDFASGIAVTCLGHAHPHLVKTLQEQAAKLWHCSNIFTIPGQQEMAERLRANTFADTVFFCNSGAEAVETGIKMVRRYHYVNGNPERHRIICAEGAFHGRTLTTIFAGGQAKHTEGFGPKVEGFDHVAFGNLNEVRAAITPETAGILMEPVQGEGGYKPADPEFIQGLRKVCDEFGLLLMYDEVQCGNGRTGKYFAHEWFDTPPDIMATAKGMGGGFPVGACLATAEAGKGMTAGTHGSTYGGNPLAMAVANAVLDVILEPGFFDGVAERGAYFEKGLQKLVADHPDTFVEQRGMGLMRGLRCAEGVNNGEFVGRLRDAGLLAVGAGENVVRMAPPLIIGEAEIDEAMRLIGEVAAGWHEDAKVAANA